MKSKKKVILIAIVVLVVLAAIIGGIVYFVKNRNTTPVDVYSMELLNSAGRLFTIRFGRCGRHRPQR